MSGRVLIVDDEQEIRRALKTGLGYQGFEVRAVATGEEALAEVGAWHPDVVLLDLGLPGLDGFEVLRRMPGKNRVAVMVVSVMPGEKDKVRALDLGADDYLVKPFGIQELSARIRAVLRRQAAVGDGRPVIRARDLEVDLEHRRVSVGGRTLHLTPTEYEVLRQLAIHAGKPVTHTMLLREVWGEYAIGDRYNTRYVITQLRKKLGDDPARPRYISTEPGVGYRLEAD
ncbi:MAG: response regulator transcription factor [Chloroflexi bacterium]|nr:MAG: response regulator transcription factor [Chloroflexota bacterium]